MLTAFDKRLLNIIQTDLPFESRPFAALAAKLETEESVVIERLKFLKQQGFIRRQPSTNQDDREARAYWKRAQAAQASHLPQVRKAEQSLR